MSLKERVPRNTIRSTASSWLTAMYPDVANGEGPRVSAHHWYTTSVELKASHWLSHSKGGLICDMGEIQYLKAVLVKGNGQIMKKREYPRHIHEMSEDGELIVQPLCDVVMFLACRRGQDTQR